MKNHNYWRRKNDIKNFNKFNKFDTIFESIMSGTPIFEDIKADPLLCVRKPDLYLIMEEIEKPQYVISESTGDAILLEDCLFWTEGQLISEGILDTVFDKVKEVYENIKKGIVSIVQENSDAIKAFCEKVMNMKVVKAIRKKLELDEKLNNEKFRKYLTVKDASGKVITESSLKRNGYVITEGTKLSKKEQAITDPKEIQEYIDKYKAALSGEKELINKKTGKPQSKDYLKTRLRLFEDKLLELNDEGESKNKASKTDADDTKKVAATTSTNKKSSKKSKKSIGSASLNSKGMGEEIKTVGEEATADDAAKSAAKTAATVEGGEEATKTLEGGSKDNEEPKKKKSWFGDKFDKGMNWVKGKVQRGMNAVSDWYAKQSV